MIKFLVKVNSANVASLGDFTVRYDKFHFLFAFRCKRRQLTREHCSCSSSSSQEQFGCAQAIEELKQ